MVAITELKVDDKVEFSIYGNINAVNSFVGTVAGIVGGQFVPTTSNAQVNHANIYPSLPDALKEIYSNDYTSYKYFHIRTEEETDLYIGFPWIVESTISYRAVGVYTLKVIGDSDDKATILTALAQRGLVVDSITYTQN